MCLKSREISRCSFRLRLCSEPHHDAIHEIAFHRRGRIGRLAMPSPHEAGRLVHIHMPAFAQRATTRPPLQPGGVIWPRHPASVTSRRLLAMWTRRPASWFAEAWVTPASVRLVRRQRVTRRLGPARSAAANRPLHPLTPFPSGARGVSVIWLSVTYYVTLILVRPRHEWPFPLRIWPFTFVSSMWLSVT